jgi:hypothetical protein
MLSLGIALRATTAAAGSLLWFEAADKFAFQELESVCSTGAPRFVP